MMRRGSWKVFLAIPAAVFATVAWAQAQDAKNDKKADKADKDGKSIVDVAKADPNLKTFVELVNEAGLTETLKGVGPYTVFAPNDAAFAKLGKEQLSSLKADKAKLKKVLMHHVVHGTHDSAAVRKMTRAKTDSGEVTITGNDNELMYGHAKVVKTDVKANNGVIHVIDAVEMPMERKPG